MITSELTKIHQKQIKAIEQLPIEKEFLFEKNNNPEKFNSFYIATQKIDAKESHLFFFDRFKFINEKTIINFIEKEENLLLYSKKYKVNKSVGIIHQNNNFLNFDYKAKDKWMGLLYLNPFYSQCFSSIATAKSWYNKLLPQEAIYKLNERLPLRTISYESIVSV